METSVIEVEQDEGPSLRETLEEAFDQSESTDTSSAPQQSEPAIAQSPVEPAGQSGSEDPQGAVPKSSDTPTPGDHTQQAQPTEQLQPTTQPLNAPAQWKPAAKEIWNSLPRLAQEEITRRESDTMRLIGTVGPKIRMADELAQHLSPFAQQLSDNGIGPSAFVSDVFGSIKTLSSGNAQEKAEVVANIVQSYGVDIRQLDAILTHRLSLPPEVYQARQLAARAQAVIQQTTASTEQQSAATAEKAIAAFAADPKHEFFGDVRDLMADLIDSGRAKTLQDAYSAAIWAHEPTRKILLERDAQSRATSKTRRASVARNASSSIHGTPSIPAPAQSTQDKMSLRESLEAAFDEHSPL